MIAKNLKSLESRFDSTKTSFELISIGQWILTRLNGSLTSLVVILHVCLFFIFLFKFFFRVHSEEGGSIVKKNRRGSGQRELVPRHSILVYNASEK